MGQATQQSPVMITLPSRNPRADADCLLQIFSGRLVEETRPAADSEDAISSNIPHGILLSDSSLSSTKRTSLLLLPTPWNQEQQHHNPSATAAITWVMEQDIATVMPKSMFSSGAPKMVHREVIRSTLVGRIDLSAASLFLIPLALYESTDGRFALARRLATMNVPEQAPMAVQDAVPLAQVERDLPNESVFSEEVAKNTKTNPVISAPVITVSSAEPNKIPSLQSHLMTSDGSFQPFELNSVEPHPFENDFFRGKVWVILKPLQPADDPYFTERIFSRRKRKIVIQIQGQFKRQPVAPVYLGGEVSPAIAQMGLITRGVFGLVVKFAQHFVPAIQFSFGSEGEKPRFVAPLHHMSHRMVVTPPHEEPPPITYEPFDEPKEFHKLRMKAATWEWNTTDTYSFSLYSMYIDLAKWKLVGIPMVPDIDLKTFWAEGHFRPVIYENVSSKKDGKHRQADNRYAMAMDLAIISGRELKKEAVPAVTVKAVVVEPQEEDDGEVFYDALDCFVDEELPALKFSGNGQDVIPAKIKQSERKLASLRFPIHQPWYPLLSQTYLAQIR